MAKYLVLLSGFLFCLFASTPPSRDDLPPRPANPIPTKKSKIPKDQTASNDGKPVVKK